MCTVWSFLGGFGTVYSVARRRSVSYVRGDEAMSAVAQLKDAWDLHQMRALNAAEFAAPKARILADPTP